MLQLVHHLKMKSLIHVTTKQHNNRTLCKLDCNVQRKTNQAKERDKRYTEIMKNLVRRYVTVEQRKTENEGVTEDDVNEIKQDISAFRCELINILHKSGMKTENTSGTGTGESSAFILEELIEPRSRELTELFSLLSSAAKIHTANLSSFSLLFSYMLILVYIILFSKGRLYFISIADKCQQKKKKISNIFFFNQ